MSRRGDHQRERRAVAKTVVGRVCWRCGEPIRRADPWDLDHVDQPWCEGGGGRRLPSHATCNRRAGAALGNARKRQRRLERQRRNDVEWSGMGIEVAADRKATWVALAGVRRSGHVIVKLLDPLPGAGVAPTLARAWDDLPSPTVGIDPRSPSATLVEPLQAEGVPLRLADARGVAVAHGLFLDLLAVGRLRVRGHAALDEAARQAATRRLAGAAAVERHGGADLSPLLAAELAVWSLGDLESTGGLRPDQVTAVAVGQSVREEALVGRWEPPPAPPADEGPGPASTTDIFEAAQRYYASKGVGPIRQKEET